MPVRIAAWRSNLQAEWVPPNAIVAAFSPASYIGAASAPSFSSECGMNVTLVRPLQLLSGLLLAVLPTSPVVAQAPDDGVLMSRRALNLGVVYAHESWSEYWEGTLKRSNDNIGTMTTQSVGVVGHYGVTDRLTLVGMLPYVWTEASQGTLHGLSGVQDLSVAAKYQVLTTPFTGSGTLSAIIVGAAGVPVSDYTPDFLPLSIGLGSRRASARMTLRFQSHGDWFLDGTAARTWRNHVKLDRVAYYTDGELYLGDRVAMPGLFDWKVSTGFRKHRFYVPVSIVQQRTLGGGDIRRQDMPFVSNRMNFTKAEAMVMYGLSVPTDLALQLGASRTLSGRNVGEATMITFGAFHTFRF